MSIGVRTGSSRPVVVLQRLLLWTQELTYFRALIVSAISEKATGDRDDARASEDDLVLVHALGEPNGGAAEEIYRRYSAHLFRFIYRRIGEQTEDAEEITLDTFLSAINLAKTFAGRSSVFVWLCGIAKLRIIDFHRRQSSAKRIARNAQMALDWLDEAMLPAHDGGQGKLSELLDRIVASQLVDAALSRLTEDEREALLLRYVEELSVREISLLMKRTERGVESLLTRARAKPRKYLLGLIGGTP
jgi:RNA polymerase sigma-70 factor (ECF subfamily)